MDKKKISLLTKIAVILTIAGIISETYIIIVGNVYLSFSPSVLVIGLYGCGFIAILYSIIGLFIGIGGLSIEIKRKNYKGIIICISCLLIYFISISAIRESSRRMACASNMKCIKLALQQYAMDYSGYFPPKNGAAGLEYLRKYDYLQDHAAFTCPSTKTTRGKANQPLTEDTVDYVYVGGLTNESKSESPILYDKLGNHKNFCNVFIIDVKSICERNWTETIFGKPLMEEIKK